MKNKTILGGFILTSLILTIQFILAVSNPISGGILEMIMGALVAFLIIGTILWVYTALAFMAIGKKAGDSMPGLAWIPGIGPALIAFRASKMPWWPWLLLIGFLIPIINFLAIIAFGIFAIIWQWKMFEAINKPGWWSILCLITPVNLIMYGIAAWSKS